MKMKLLNKQDINKLRREVYTTLMNKYYNLFMDSYKFDGPSPEQEDYMMRQFWAIGTVAAFKIKHTDDIGIVPYAAQNYNMYDFPANVLLINKRGLPFIPNSIQEVDKDVALGWIQANHKPIREICEYYIDRLTTVEMVINTNLHLQKLPWAIGIDPTDTAKAQDIIDRILNDELVIFMSFDDLNNIRVLATSAPYIIDKLCAYRYILENTLLTYLGIDSPESNSKAHEYNNLDETNSNNEMIQTNRDAYLKHIKDFLKKIKELFGVEWTVKSTHKPVASVHEEPEREREAEEDV